MIYYCSYCKSEVPRVYLESDAIPATKIGMIGYSGHGKTTYKTALLYLLKSIHPYWNDFFFETLDDDSHKAMYYDVDEFEKGKFPAATRAVFPRPAFILLNHTPFFNSRYISLFDTGGQLFENLELMTRKGRYFTQVNVIFFFISLNENEIKENWNLKIMKLLDRYIHVVYSRYGTKTAKYQDIAFILTKSDQLLNLEGEQKLPDQLTDYYTQGTIEKYRQINTGLFEAIIQNSKGIEAWLRANNCNSFINYARNHFRNISFMLTSAANDSIAGNRFAPDGPKCILDPLLWAMHQAR